MSRHLCHSHIFGIGYQTISDFIEPLGPPIVFSLPITKFCPMRAFQFALLLTLLLPLNLLAQNGVIKGRVFNSINNEPVPFANVVLQGTTTGASTDFDGLYEITGLEPGNYNVECTVVGFAPKTQFEVQVSNARSATVDFPLVANAQELDAVEIKASPFSKTEESPVSLRTIGVDEIQRAPGGNRDISVVIQNLPGVASTPSFRNDIIIRGGAPNENRFFLDGVEVPNINHFATQGSSGGPVGMINVNFLQEVDYFAGAFPTNRGNALSSVFDFKQREGNKDGLKGTFLLGSSDAGLTFDGPIGKNTSFILSARRSYLQFLFQALKLPFLPTYNDAQLKVTHKFNQKNTLNIIGLGALDDFAINTSVNDGVTDPETLERNNYILGNVPVNDQWNYTLGAVYKHFSKRSFQQVVVSRNHLFNRAFKYFDNDDSSEDNLLLDYTSQEIENKVRLENTFRDKGWRINYGAGYELAQYTNETFNKVVTPGGVITVDYNSELFMSKYSAFGSVARGLLDQRLTVSLGLRTDFNDYSSDMSNPLNQLSPRLSASYQVNEKWSINANTGRYYQLPAYTILGYRDASDALVNKDLGVKYIQADHLVGGVEYNPNLNSKITVEGFYKLYENYPFLLNDSIALANLGADFGVIGNEPVIPIGEGRSYGVEVLAQQKVRKGFYGIMAYTFVRSEFKDRNGAYVPTAWDSRHIVNATAGKKFKKNWEVGIKFRYQGGLPFTPADVDRSSLREVWDVTGQAVYDYAELNTQRVGASHGLDLRVDKKYFFDKWSLNVYFDIQNAYGATIPQPATLRMLQGDDGSPVVDPNDATRYQPYFNDAGSGTVLPSIGIQIDF